MRQKWFNPSLPSNDVIWYTNCDMVEDYGLQFGTCNCPRTCVCVLPDGREINIGLWLRNQRMNKKGNMGKFLTKERELRLQELVDQGKLWWDIKERRDWDYMYAALVDYGRRNGTCNVPHGWKEVSPDGEVLNLGQWVGSQRWRRFTHLTEERRQKMQALVDQGLFKWHMVSW